MTGFLNPGSNPLSKVTIASLKDLGYEVKIAAANPFSLPSHLELSLAGVWSDEHPHRCLACGAKRRGAVPVVLPESAVMR